MFPGIDIKITASVRPYLGTPHYSQYKEDDDKIAEWCEQIKKYLNSSKPLELASSNLYPWIEDPKDN